VHNVTLSHKFGCIRDSISIYYIENSNDYFMKCGLNLVKAKQDEKYLQK